MNRWKNYVWMAAGVAALTVVGAFTAKPLLAQIKAALVQNVDEPGRIPYQSSAVFAQGSPGPATGFAAARGRSSPWRSSRSSDGS